MYLVADYVMMILGIVGGITSISMLILIAIEKAKNKTKQKETIAQKFLKQEIEDILLYNKCAYCGYETPGQFKKCSHCGAVL